VNIQVYANAMGASTSVNTKGKNTITVKYNNISKTYNYSSSKDKKMEDTELNATFGWDNSWIPNGHTHAVYTGVHHVAAGQYHSSVLVFAAPGSSIFDKDKSGKYINPYAERFICYDGQKVKYLTLGAGDTDGKLISDINRKRDLDMGRKVQVINMPIYDVNKINSLIANERHYHANTTDINYDIFPSQYKTTGGYGEGYNSNSFVAGLLTATGITRVTPTYSVPGFSKPVPTNHYKDEW
jgi:hypothetical protein